MCTVTKYVIPVPVSELASSWSLTFWLSHWLLLPRGTFETIVFCFVFWRMERCTRTVLGPLPWPHNVFAVSHTHTVNEQFMIVVCVLHCVSKNIPDVFDSNLNKNYQILIIFGVNIPDTTCHWMAVQFFSSSVFYLTHVCFCTTWGN